MLNKILSPIVRRVTQRGVQKRFDHHGHHSDYRFPTMDDCCVPQGNWQENYEKMQRKYNMYLIAGVSSLVLTIFSIAKFELLYFNYYPPSEEEVKRIMAEHISKNQ